MELYLKPATWLVIKKPDGSNLDADGEKVQRTSFWLKRLVDGDVNEVKPAAKATKKPQAKE